MMKVSTCLAFSLLVLSAIGLIVTPASATDVLFVLSGDQAQNGLSRQGDILVNDFFVGRGYTVQLMDEEAPGGDMLAASDAADLTYVSESVGSGNVGNKVTPSTTGVITSEAFLQDDLLFTQNDDCCRANANLLIEVDVVDDLGVGLPTGVIPVFDQAGTIGWGVPGGDVTIAATMVGEATQATNYLYEVGDALNDGSAAAGQRVFMGSMTGLTLDPNPVWTAQGEALFSAAVDFALIPEPSSVVLFALGIVGLLMRRRRV